MGRFQGRTDIGLDFWATENGVHSSAAIGVEQVSTDTYRGSLLFSTRGVNSDSAPTERMRIDPVGNVGIGTTAPYFTAANRASLSVNGASSSILAFGKNDTSENYILADAGGFTIANTSATLPTVFYTSGSERLRITAAGTTEVTGGFEAAQPGAGANAFAAGVNAGNSGQATSATAVGLNAGYENQAASAVAIGNSAGNNTQGDSSVAVGNSAGFSIQAAGAVAVGRTAGRDSQGSKSVAIGYDAARTTQGNNAVAIGWAAGQNTQGGNSVAIGNGAGRDNQPDNGILINSSGTVQNAADPKHIYLVSGSQKYLYYNGADTWKFEGGDVTIPNDGLLVGTTSSLGSAYPLQIERTNEDCFYAARSTGDVYGRQAGVSLRNTTLGVSAAVAIFGRGSGLASAYVNYANNDGSALNSYMYQNSGIARISSTVAHIGTTSGTVIGTQTSDERLKDIEPTFEYGIDTVMSLQPIAYKRSDLSSPVRQLGFGAQTTQAVVPEAVYDTGECLDGYDTDPEDAMVQTAKSEDTKLAMEYVQLVPVLTKAIQEQQAMIETLQAEVAALKGA